MATIQEENEVLCAMHLISLDPTIRNAMAGAEAADRTSGSAYYSMMNWTPGAVISWIVVARVLESKHPDYAVGDMVTGFAPLRKFFTLVPVPGMHSKLPSGVAPTAFLSTMGATAMTGYMGAKHIGEPKEGEVAFVSGAAGATGLIACQTFKKMGCRVLGSAGTDEKVAMLKDLGVEAFNYKQEATLEALKRLCPDGFDVAFDNVGGETLEAMLEMINDKGRVALCGAISQYDTPPEKKYGIKNLFHVIAKQVRIQGFLVFAFTPEQTAECLETLGQWVQEGTLKDTSTVVEGFEKFPEALMGLFAGQNTGKMMVREALA